MDVNTVLKNTLSPDAAARTDAENQLNTAAEQNFSLYLQTLAQELANENADQDVRMAAGLALKNPFAAREYQRAKEVQNRWQQVGADVKTGVKQLALNTLASNASRVGAQAAQFVATVAAIEIPRNQWPELLPALVNNIRDGHDNQKQACLATIGYICENDDAELRSSLSAHSNTILTAVVQGARKEEANADVRNTAMTALGDSLEFVRSNFENEGERNYIMQVVCEATQAQDSRIQQAAYGCLNRIMALYYDKMYFYMEKALFGLTIQGMKNEDEDVAKLAVEFWCTVCEEEISIEDDNTQAAQDNETQRPYFNFAKIATQEVVPVLLELLTKQDEDAADEEYNIHRASYQCLQLWAQAVQGIVVPAVLPFVEKNLRESDWHQRDAAVSAFGAIMEGPDEKTLDTLVKQALPVLIGMMEDQNVQVRDSTAFALGRISENVSSAIEPSVHLPPLVSSLFAGLASNPKIASSCCWALMNLADRFTSGYDAAENAMTPHFDASVEHLMNTTARNDIDNTVRTACYEVLATFIGNAASNSIPTVAKLSDMVLQRLESTIPMRQQVVSVEDRLTLDEVQTSLSTVVMSIVQRVQSEIKPQADRIMTILLQVLNSLNGKSSVAESVFAAISSLSNALEEDFQKYLDSFMPILFKALNNRDDPSICAMAIGLVSDLSRSLNGIIQPYCNEFMNSLLENLRSPQLSNQFKPAILQCFGDIAQAIGGAFESYLQVVVQVLEQAAGVPAAAGISYEMLDYLVSLREGIMDAWAGAIMAMKSSGKSDVLKPYVENIFRMLNLTFTDQNRSEALLRSAMGVLGDLADAFPNGEYADYYRNDWVLAMVKEVRQNREFTQSTIDTARWAREQVKRQVNGAHPSADGSMMS